MPWAISTKTIKPQCLMCQLKPPTASFWRPVSGLCCFKSTAAGKHLIIPPNSGHTGESPQQEHPMVGQKGCEAWQETSTKNPLSQAFSQPVTKLTTQLSQLFTLGILPHKASQPVSLPFETGPQLALSCGFKTGRPAPKKAAFCRNPYEFSPSLFLLP